MNSFDYYQKLAETDTLKNNEKVGRSGKHPEHDIFLDMLRKIRNLSYEQINICDIGCGCSKPVLELIEHSKEKQQNLFLIDGKSMLSQLSDHEKNIKKIDGCFPSKDIIEQIKVKMDVIIIYSVFQYVFKDGNIVDFLDSAVELLNDNGELFLGDIPNNSKLQRFLNSDFGCKFYQDYNNTKELPKITFSSFEKNVMDDSVISYIFNRYRGMGYDVYILPQNEKLPFCYSREDILIRKH